MRLAVFGGGTMSLDYPYRDGKIIWRRELFRRLERLGVDVVYLAPPEFSAGAEPDYRKFVVGWEWRGEVDAVMLETRYSFFSPDPELNKHLTEPFYWQGRLLEDWVEGALGDPVWFAQDGDAVIRKSLGLGGVKSLYESGAVWRDLVPGAVPALRKLRDELECLVHSDPKTHRLETKRDGEYRVRFFPWGYPESIEVPLNAKRLVQTDEKTWELFYSGADYGRRNAFWRFYVEAAQAGLKVGVGGEWNNRRKGAFGDGRKGKGFKKQVEQEAGPLLTFVNGGSTLPQRSVMNELRHSLAGVQILRSDYVRMGFCTNRPAEMVAAGCVPLVDARIASPGGDAPHDWFRVDNVAELVGRVRALQENDDTRKRALKLWRQFLRRRGTVKQQARQLVRWTEEAKL